MVRYRIWYSTRFNIQTTAFFSADQFFTVNDIDIPSYVDDNTPYIIAVNVDDLIASLEQPFNGLFQWFKNNLLQSNADKCHLLVSTNDRVSMNVDRFKIDKSDAEKLLGARFDKKLTFGDNISDMDMLKKSSPP